MAGIRNVLFVTFDQWRGDHLGAAGHPVLRTPVLDELIADATWFTRHYSVTAPCGPARTSLFTGTYLNKHRALHNGTPLSERFTTLALEARKASFDPGLFGYTDISPDPRGKDPADPIFNTYEGVLPGMTRLCRLDEDFGPWLADLKRKGYAVPERPWDIFRPERVEERRPYCAAPARFRAADSISAFLTERVLDHLDGLGGKPFFLHLSYIVPHPPWIAPAPHHDRYRPEDMPAPIRADRPEGEAGHPWLGNRLEAFQAGKGHGMHAFIGEGIDAKHFGPDQQGQIRATYCGMINEVEDQFARVLAWLKVNNAWDDTLIVLTADHGEQLGDHWMYGKLGFFDQSYHVPLIIRDPRPEAAAGRGRRVEAFTESVDVTPTVLAALGLDVPRQMDGVPLTAWLEGRVPERWRDAVHFEFDFGNPQHPAVEQALGLTSDQCRLSVLRSADCKYVHFSHLPPLFFDLKDDPREVTNRADDPAYAARMLQAAQEMLSWRMACEDATLTHVTIDRGPQYAPDRRFDGML